MCCYCSLHNPAGVTEVAVVPMKAAAGVGVVAAVDAGWAVAMVVVVWEVAGVVAAVEGMVATGA
jgi:hypothetical protein